MWKKIKRLFRRGGGSTEKGGAAEKNDAPAGFITAGSIPADIINSPAQPEADFEFETDSKSEADIEPETDFESETSLKNASPNSQPPRQKVLKTYKLYINGEFPRSESNRSYPVYGTDEELLAHAVLSTRKDLRNAVLAARSAQTGWASRTAYNRGQILYRVAEILETRASSLIEEVIRSGGRENEVYESIDRWVWYAGWADKFPAVLGGANPVAGPYFNFTTPEPVGVVAVIAPNPEPLLGIVSRLAPVLVSGNSVIALASEKSPLPAVALAEALAVSDMPAGVINILTGSQAELAEHIISHADINAVDISGLEASLAEKFEPLAADSMKRIIRNDHALNDPALNDQSPYLISDFCEMKTVWHPVGR